MIGRSVAVGGLVVCVGDVMVDVTARLSGPLRRGSDTPAQIQWRGGGSAANTACWLRAAGTESLLIARVGGDPLGEWAGAQLEAAGVAGRLVTDPDAGTGTCLVLIDQGGERTMVPDAGANAALAPGDIDPLPTDAQHLHLSGYALFGAPRAAMQALTLARTAEMTLSVGAASAGPLADYGAERFFAAVGAGVLLFANRAEATVLAGPVEVEQLAKRLAGRVGEAVITDGAGGATWSDGERCSSVVPAPLRVVDSTGAGDSFAAGFLAARGRGETVDEALSAAHQWAAEACRQIGGRPV